MDEQKPKKKFEFTKVITILFVIILILYLSGSLDSLKEEKSPAIDSTISTEQVR